MKPSALILTMLSFGAFTDTCSSQSSPLELANTVVERWAGASLDRFTAVFPFPEGREVFSDTSKAQFDRVRGVAKVLHVDGAEASILISGVPVMGNSGDSTEAGRAFSGVYEAHKQGEKWILTRQVPLEEQGQIESHRLAVQVKPAAGIDVSDDMTVRVRTHNGFAVRLNYKAQLHAVTVNKRSVKYLFGGGLLWIDLPPGSTDVALNYSIAVEESPNDTNSGAFFHRAGHVRNQYFWHPFFDFASSGDRATFAITARIPSGYRLSTSLPQTERIEGGQRVVEGRTIRPTFALSLIYDLDWKVTTEQLGPIRLELFLKPDFKPATASVVEEFRSVCALLTSRFGVPKASYFGIVQDESRGGNGWYYASNQIVVAAGWPRIFSSKDHFPRAFLGHEVGHLWTNGSGPAANFLGEGWATYVESLVLRKEFDAATVQLFWKQEAESYFTENDGKASILMDEENSGVSYSKGAWVFHMLEEIAGETVFDEAMADYSKRSLQQAAGWEVLADCFQHQAPGFDARAFLLPWLKEKTVPQITVEARGASVTIHQKAPFFTLPVTVEGITTHGLERHTVWISGEQVAIPFSGEISDPKIDPDHSLLLKPS